MVAKRYTLGTGLVISAVNHLVSKYGKTERTNPGVLMDSLLGGSFVDEDEDDSVSGITIPQKQDSINITSTKDAYSPILAEEEDNEKTQIAVSPSFSKKDEKNNKFESVWNEYKNIKLKNGQAVSIKEKESFINKLKTNRISIMEKYKCKDVDFYIENKNGKPVVKAKPLK